MLVQDRSRQVNCSLVCTRGWRRTFHPCGTFSRTTDRENSAALAPSPLHAHLSEGMGVRQMGSALPRRWDLSAI
jgi:hypothetical protein